VTAATTNGSAVREVVVDWGDGQSQSLGAVVGNAVVSHTYSRDGSYVVTGTVTDASGNKTTVSTAVTVIQAPTPTVIITPTPQSAPAGSTISFAIDIRAPTGVSIRGVVVNWGDGQPSQTLGGASGVITLTHRYAVIGTYTVTVTVEDSTSVVTTGTTTVSITQ
jgi:PKD repeat protein